MSTTTDTPSPPSSSHSSYYDIDAILAEEELVPCTTLFDFSHLAHLDPDARNHYLPETSRIKLPLWAMKRWANLGFVRLSLPRHYARRARERLEADPGDADLRKRNERFFASGRMLVDLIDQSTQKVAKSIAKQRRSARRTAHTAALEQVQMEAQDLRTTLLKTFGGERLRKTLDWALSTGDDDDVSRFTSQLTDLEQRLFQKGTKAVSDHQHWTLFGNHHHRRRPRKSNNNTVMATPASQKNAPSTVTPGDDHDDSRRSNHDDDSNKRRRMG